MVEEDHPSVEDSAEGSDAFDFMNKLAKKVNQLIASNKVGFTISNIREDIKNTYSYRTFHKGGVGVMN